MPEYTPVPRMSANSSRARLRRVAGSFQVPGSTVAGKTVSVVNSAYSITSPVERVLVSAGSSQRIINLPSVSSALYKDIPIHVQKIDSGAGSVRLLPVGGEFIGTSASSADIFREGDAFTIISDGSVWRIIGDKYLLPTTFGAVSEVGDGTTTIARPVQVVTVDATNGNATINLPNRINYFGVIIHVKKIDSSANTVTVDAGSETIDGSNTRVLTTQYEVLSVIAVEEWNILFLGVP